MELNPDRILEKWSHVNKASVYERERGVTLLTTLVIKLMARASIHIEMSVWS